jgi:hypothetical protein
MLGPFSASIDGRPVRLPTRKAQALLAYLALGSSMTALLIVAGLSGQAPLAAEMAVIQGALLATFYAFSANARSLILQGHDDLTTERLLAD